MTKILGVSSSLREGAHTRILVSIALEGAREAGAEVELLDLRETPLPLYDHREDINTYPQAENVHRIAQLVSEADGFIIGSPEYHGSMSGAAKNFFDFHYHEFAGKLMGFVAATGGSQGTSAITHMRASAQYCHAWTLPYHIGASGGDFDTQGLKNSLVRDRLLRIGRDLSIYAPILRSQFQKDLHLPGKSPVNGFAEWHRVLLG